MFNMVSFSNTKTKEIFSFNDIVCTLSNEFLNNILKRDNFDNDGCEITLLTSDNIKIADLIQIKILIDDIGSFTLHILKDNFSIDIKNKLFEQLKSLRTKETTLEIQKEKISKMYSIIFEYHPIYITFINNGKYILSTNDLESILLPLKPLFPTIIINSTNKIDFLSAFGLKKTKEKVKKEKQHNKKQSEEVINNTVASKEKRTQKEKIKKQHRQILFIPFLKKFYVDYVFLAIFTITISFAFYSGVIFAHNSNTTCIFLFIINVLFLGPLIYVLYDYVKQMKKWKTTFESIFLPIIFVLIGIGIGTFVGYLISFYVLPKQEGIIIDYNMICLYTILESICLSILSIPILSVIYKIRYNKYEND